MTLPLGSVNVFMVFVFVEWQWNLWAGAPFSGMWSQGKLEGAGESMDMKAEDSGGEDWGGEDWGGEGSE